MNRLIGSATIGVGAGLARSEWHFGWLGFFAILMFGLGICWYGLEDDR